MTLKNKIISLQEAKNNAQKRNELIEQYKPFIYFTASNICKRSLQWENDEELSVALLAFNEALDAYDADKAGLEGFAKLVIQRRLIDYFRKEHKHRNLSLDLDLNDNSEALWEAEAAIANYYLKNEQQERINAINCYNLYLQKFDITFAELADYSPKHTDTRNKLINAAVRICEEEGMVTGIMSKKRLPVLQISILTSLSRKMIKTWRKYLIALIIVFQHEELSIIREFINITPRRDIDEA